MNEFIDEDDIVCERLFYSNIIGKQHAEEDDNGQIMFISFKFDGQWAWRHGARIVSIRSQF